MGVPSPKIKLTLPGEPSLKEIIQSQGPKPSGKEWLRRLEARRKKAEAAGLQDDSLYEAVMKIRHEAKERAQ